MCGSGRERVLEAGVGVAALVAVGTCPPSAELLPELIRLVFGNLDELVLQVATLGGNK